MQKVFEIICWAAVGMLALFAIVYVLTRGLVVVGLVLLFARSSLPWWVLIPVAIALAAGFVYLFRGMRTRARPNRRYVNR